MSESELRFFEGAIGAGNSAFTRQVVIPAAEAFEELSSEHPATPTDLSAVGRIEPQFSASGTALAGLVGILAFVGGWAGNKALEELYQQKIRPRIVPRLSEFLRENKSNKKYALSLAIVHPKNRVTVFIAAIGKNDSELQESECQIPGVLALATRIAETSTQSGVHMYLIEEGQCNTQPIVEENLSKALKRLDRMHPAKPPAFTQNAS